MKGQTKYEGLTKKVLEVVVIIGPVSPTDVARLADCEDNYAVCWGVLLALCEMGKIERLDNGLYIAL